MKIPLHLVGLVPRRLQVIVESTIYLCGISLGCIVISVASAQSPTPTPTATPTPTPTPTATPSPTPSPPPPSDVGPTALITFPDNTSLSVWSTGGVFPVVATLPGESLNIQLQFPSSFANTQLIVQVMDGGDLGSGQDTQTIASDGTASIQFQIPTDPGAYRVLLIAGGAITRLQLGVSNP